MARGLFITGTDTGIGKTQIATAVVAALVARGQRVAAMKPVASGAIDQGAGLRNDDALALMTVANCVHPYELVNPYCFSAPIAPHLAAAQTGESINLGVIESAYQVLARNSDWVVVEGVGGWQVPLNENQSQGDIAVNLGLPVIMVVGLRLGCLNHALLTAHAIQQTGLKMAGWVANGIDLRFEEPEANIAALQQRLSAPLLGHVPTLSPPISIEKVAAWLDLSTLFAST